jgi:hypothetical protein
MSIRSAAWIAWLLCLLCVALAVASLIFALLNGRTLGEIFLALDGPSIATFAILTVSFSVVGALIASHRPENPIGWIFLAEGFCCPQRPTGAAPTGHRGLNPSDRRAVHAPQAPHPVVHRQALL